MATTKTADGAKETASIALVDTFTTTTTAATGLPTAGGSLTASQSAEVYEDTPTKKCKLSGKLSVKLKLEMLE